MCKSLYGMQILIFRFDDINFICKVKPHTKMIINNYV